MDKALSFAGDHWYLIAGLFVPLFLVALIGWRLARTNSNGKVNLLDVLLVWPVLLRRDRTMNEKSYWITRRELLWGGVMIVIAVVAILVTPGGRSR